MSYISSINDQSYTVDIGENKHQRDIRIEDMTRTIDWRQVAPLAADARGQTGEGGQYSLIIGGKSYQVFARRLNTPDEKDGNTYEIQVAGQRFEVRVEDEHEKAIKESITSAHEVSQATVRAPMPGLVLGVPLAVGASVARGQTVVILEAMKMENDLSSPIAGTIKEIRVDQGQTVNQGDVLVVISAA
jgi:biotin carboxyl carrier protein